MCICRLLTYNSQNRSIEDALNYYINEDKQKRENKTNTLKLEISKEISK